MLALHFGAGNIGRGFIGEVLNQNNAETVFVDVNDEIITALNDKKSYPIELAIESKYEIIVNNVQGINNSKHPEKVVETFTQADIVTTAIGPGILPLIAPLIAEGIQERKAQEINESLDIIACENMIDGSHYLKEEVLKHLDSSAISFVDQYIGFPNAAVDRIVPMQEHEDILKVMVEPYKEWLVEEKDLKNKNLRIRGVGYVKDLTPFIERKLFTVNTGHATTAYNGRYAGYEVIDEALLDEHVLKEVQSVLTETKNLLIAKWDFSDEEHNQYIETILNRFKNPYISDELTRVGRTPIRKLGYNERFVRPLREAYERDLEVEALVRTIAKILVYRDEADEESQKLAQLLTEKNVEEVVQEITELKDQELIDQIVTAYQKLDH